VDGTPNRNGTITHACDLIIKKGHKKERQKFFVSNLGKDRFILGYPWCKTFVPDIDWENAKLRGPTVKAETIRSSLWNYAQERLKQKSQQEQDNDLVMKIDATIMEEDASLTGEHCPSQGIRPGKAEDTETPEIDWKEYETAHTLIRATTAIEMAHKYAEKNSKEEVTLPEEFKRHAALFSDEEAKKFPPTRGDGDHKIELTAEAPDKFNCKLYPMSLKDQETEDKFLDKNLEKGYIVPSSSLYGFSTFMVAKKDSNEKCYIIDYCPLNTVTRKDVTPLPNLAQCIEDLQGMEIFSKFDIRWGYNNIRIREGDEWKGAFKTRRGLFEPKVMFFGMSNSPPTFQRFMNGILEELYRHFEKKGVHNIRKIFRSYMDDCGLGTMAKDYELHMEILHYLFDLFARHGLHLKLSKSVFMAPSIDFLGVRINKNGATIDPAKIAGIAEWPENITTLKGARSFIGVCGYHRMFIPGFSSIAAPITRLFGKDVPFEWTQECKDALRDIKKRITTAPVLVQPDPSKQFELEVDASQIATGAILYQRGPKTTLPDGREKPSARHPVGFHSQKFSTTEQNYPIYDREFLAIMRGLRNWNYLLKGTTEPVLVYTDHANLRYYRDPWKIGLRVAGYLPEREQYNILLEYKPGATNWADGLSRREDYDTGSNPDNDDITVWPDHYFCEQHTSIRTCHVHTSEDGSNPGNGRPGREEEAIRVYNWDSTEDNLDKAIKQAQYKHQADLKRWADAHGLSLKDGTHWH